MDEKIQPPEVIVGPQVKHQLLQYEAKIKKEEAKVKRCERLGLRHKNKLGKLIDEYMAFQRSHGLI